MSRSVRSHRTARCRCGEVALDLVGEPIISAVCYCESCQRGSQQISTLPNGRAVCDPNGGTAFVLFRKDRVAHEKGASLLRGYRLSDTSSTERVVATCCNSFMYLSFDRGHWLSVYSAALEGEPPPPEMRVQTRSRRDGSVLPDDVPSYPGHPMKFMTRLFLAWIPMLLRR